MIRAEVSSRSHVLFWISAAAAPSAVKVDVSSLTPARIASSSPLIARRPAAASVMAVTLAPKPSRSAMLMVLPAPVSDAVAVGPAELVRVCGESKTPASTPPRPLVGADVFNPVAL